ncbi:MAG: hypothetical protein DVB25_08520 [Verrucomicrobia bacterium]|nr:MAG: hypothetical protein DVB25_08520 [Verrucomicrobiota bacterium]
MNAQKPAAGLDLLGNPPDFSLVLGGPLFQLLCRAHLANDALQLLGQRVIVIVLVTWLPLVVLTALEGHLVGSGARLALLMDAEVHSRLLVALPLLVIAEMVVHRRMRLLLRQFLERQLIAEKALPQFEAAIAAAFRLRNSVFAELLLIALVYGVGILIVWHHFLAFHSATWYATPTADGSNFSLAGIWYGFVSLPVFQFLLFRWYFRLLVWSRFLWQVSRIELCLMPTHPDHLGGLGFLSNTVYAFSMLAVAHGALLAGLLANRIFFLGATLSQFKAEIAVLLGFLLCAIFFPLLVFMPQLAAAKRRGLREYGALAGRYVREFDTKWLRGGAPLAEPLVGSSDIQSLADLANSYEVLRMMRIVPLSKDAVIQLAVWTLLPLAPLLLTLMPLEEILKKLFSIVL